MGLRAAPPVVWKSSREHAILVSLWCSLSLSGRVVALGQYQDPDLCPFGLSSRFYPSSSSRGRGYPVSYSDQSFCLVDHLGLGRGCDRGHPPLSIEELVR